MPLDVLQSYAIETQDGSVSATTVGQAVIEVPVELQSVAVEIVVQGMQGPPGPGTGPPINLVDAATIAVDASLGKLFRVTIEDDRTLGNPTNIADGQMLMFEIKQDAVGSRGLVLASKYHFGDGFPGPIAWSTAPNKTDRLLVQYVLDRDQLDVIGFKEGF